MRLTTSYYLWNLICQIAQSVTLHLAEKICQGQALYSFLGPFLSYKENKVLWIRNCYIHAEQKISFMNKTKWFEIWPRPKDWVRKIFLAQKIYKTLPPNFGMGLYKSCHKFCPFSMSWTKVREMQQIFNENSKSV